jgi:hypothetical protein
MADRGLPFFRGDEGAGQILVSLGVSGIECDRRLELFDRLLAAVQFHQCHAKIVAGLGKIRPDGKSLTVVCDRRVQSIYLDERVGQIVVDRGGVRSYRERLFEARDRLIRPLEPKQRVAEIVVRVDPIRFERDGFLIFGNRVLRSSERRESYPEIVVNGSRVRRASGGRAQVLDGLGRPAGMGAQDAEVVQRAAVGRDGTKHRPVHLLRLPMLPAAME